MAEDRPGRGPRSFLKLGSFMQVAILVPGGGVEPKTRRSADFEPSVPFVLAVRFLGFTTIYRYPPGDRVLPISAECYPVSP